MADESLFMFSYSCLINEGDTFLLLGGKNPDSSYTSSAIRYSIDGWVGDLNNMKRSRVYAGCTQYINDDGSKVLKDIKMKM